MLTRECVAVVNVQDAIVTEYPRRVEAGARIVDRAMEDLCTTRMQKAAERAETWQKIAMVEDMDQVPNEPSVGGSLVSVEVETHIGKTWAG